MALVLVVVLVAVVVGSLALIVADTVGANRQRQRQQAEAIAEEAARKQAYEAWRRETPNGPPGPMTGGDVVALERQVDKFLADPGRAKKYGREVAERWRECREDYAHSGGREYGNRKAAFFVLAEAAGYDLDLADDAGRDPMDHADNYGWQWYVPQQ